jgi:hypothetical protein
VALTKMFRNNNLAKTSTQITSKGVDLCDRFINTLNICGRMLSEEEFKKWQEIPEMDNEGNIMLKGRQVISVARDMKEYPSVQAVDDWFESFLPTAS